VKHIHVIYSTILPWLQKVQKLFHDSKQEQVPHRECIAYLIPCTCMWRKHIYQKCFIYSHYC